MSSKGRRQKTAAASELLRQLSLTVRANYELPQAYASNDPKVVEELLTMGATVFDAVQTQRYSQELQDVEARKEKAVADIRAAADARIQELQGLLHATEEQKVSLQREHAARQQELAAMLAHKDVVASEQLQEVMHATEEQKVALQREHAARHQELTDMIARKDVVASEQSRRAYETGSQEARQAVESRIQTLESQIAAHKERNDALLERKRILEEERAIDLAAAETRTEVRVSTLLQRTLDEKERTIQRFESMFAGLQDSYAKQQAELRALNEQLRARASTNVKTKGTDYEVIFREKLLAAFGTADKFALTDSARNGVGHAGDYLMTMGQHTVLWEVKNYDRPVPTQEVEKFMRDMRENQQARIGVMVSRCTPILGKSATGDRHVEFLEGKMLIYLNRFELMSDDTLAGLMLLFKLWWESDKNIEEGETKEAAIRMIERLHANAVKSRVEWRLHKSRADEMLRWMAQQVDENEEVLQNALRTLQGGKAVDKLTIPMGVFRAYEGDDRAQQIVAWIVENTVAAESSSLVLNDLADNFAKFKGLSRDTARQHIKSVLLDATIEPAKGKMPAKVRGLAFTALPAAPEENVVVMEPA